MDNSFWPAGVKDVLPRPHTSTQAHHAADQVVPGSVSNLYYDGYLIFPRNRTTHDATLGQDAGANRQITEGLLTAR